MSTIITKDNLFRPTRSKAETKAEMTDSAAPIGQLLALPNCTWIMLAIIS